MMQIKTKILGLMLCLSYVPFSAASTEQLLAQLDNDLEPLMKKVVEWRHDLHQFPELSNREFKTSKKVEDHLRSLGLKVTTGIAHTGVVAILKGGKPGPLVALRADMDGLPVTEMTGLSFASAQTDTYNGQEVGVMHACGHDVHITSLIGTAKQMIDRKDQWSGTCLLYTSPSPRDRG